MTDAARPASADPSTLLADVADALVSTDDLDDLLREVLGAATRIAHADGGAVFLQDPDRVELEPAVAVGTVEGALDQLAGSLGLPDDPIAATAREQRSRRADGPAGGGFATLTGSRRTAFAPLSVRREGIDLPLGVLALAWTEAVDLTPSADRLVVALARLMSVAVDRARLASLVAERSEWFERMTQSDALTGLANERTFARVLELELARAGRQGGELSLALFDVDGFVATNEERGHEAGDDVLREVAGVLTESTRLVDTVARVGGDEFVLVAPGPAGMTVARRIVAGVSALAPREGRPISVSAGIARFPADGTSADELIEAATAALGRAKAQGPGTLLEAGAQAAT